MAGHVACLTDQQPSPSDSVRTAAGSLAPASVAPFLGFDCRSQAPENPRNRFLEFPGMQKGGGMDSLMGTA